MVKYSYMPIYFYYIFLCLENVEPLFQKFSKISKRDQSFFFILKKQIQSHRLPDGKHSGVHIECGLSCRHTCQLMSLGTVKDMQ